MDRFIASFPAADDRDLVVCVENGVAYQRDMRITASYDASYFGKCASYEGSTISDAIHRGRVELVNRHIGVAAGVLDVGIGSGEFIRARPYTWGYDINPTAVAWLQGVRRWSDSFAAFDAFTFWDVIEHVPVPEDYFRRIDVGGYLFASVPIFDDLMFVRRSKHYRPGEHLYYWTERGFVDWMRLHGFRLLERADFETVAGRDSILSFAFVRDAALLLKAAASCGRAAA